MFRRSWRTILLALTYTLGEWSKADVTCMVVAVILFADVAVRAEAEIEADLL